ncbi:hypocretin neuropeptide precursor [Salminus brasiliensis]|uniref:hypocretin neuropeptide precursor n=1 Tax=Salminus brasiliensis TaxID=930266 RepID=UPI003B82D766
MTGDHIKPSGADRHMAISSAKVLLFLALLAQVSRAAEGVSGCCARRPRACGLYGLLCNATDAKPVRVSSDAAAGILTLGKRKAAESRYQDRLQHLLHGARNQAAGILTMGRRDEEGGARFPPGMGTTVHAPVKLDLERPVQHLLQRPEATDSYGR